MSFNYKKIINFNEPFLQNFMSKGKVNLDYLTEWCRHNSYSLEKIPIFTKGLHNIDAVSIFDYHKRPITTGYLKSANHNEHFIEFLYSHIANALGLRSAKTLLCSLGNRDDLSFSQNIVQKQDEVLIDSSILFLNPKVASNSVWEISKKLHCLQQECPCDMPSNFVVDRNLSTNLTKLAIFDFCFGGSDRRNGNFAFVMDESTRVLKLAPIWDNGHACGMFSPRLKEEVAMGFDTIATQNSCDYGVRLGIFNSYAKDYMLPKEFLDEIDSPLFLVALQKMGVNALEIKSFIDRIKEFDVENFTSDLQRGFDMNFPNEVIDAVCMFKNQRTPAISKAFDSALLKSQGDESLLSTTMAKPIQTDEIKLFDDRSLEIEQ